MEDPLLAEYVNRLGQNLVRNSDAKVPFTFQVIEGEAPNAFALPGGYIFVYTGLLKIASEESEAAAAMAHEIAHVAARHMTCQATKSQLANIASLPASILLGGLGGYAVRQGAGVAVPTALLHFGRKDESEADYLGLQYMYAAGYDPNGAISLFEKIESLEPEATRPGGSHLLHPPDGRRSHRESRGGDPAHSPCALRVHRDDQRVHGDAGTDALARGQAEERRSVASGSCAARPRADKPADEDRPTIKRRDLTD